jgi:uracil-DNA glycosylase
VRCAPPDNRPSPAEFRRCAPFLLEELQALRPSLRVILPLGALAWGSTLTLLAAAGYRIPSPLPRFAHGAEATIAPETSGQPLALLGSYHVSRQNTNTGRLTRDMFARILSRARDLTSPAAPSR